MKTASPKNIWIVSEESPGHLSQSVGLAKALSERTPVTSHTITGRLTVRGWIRPLIRFYMGKNARPLPPALLKKSVKFDIQQPQQSPDLIISSGGKSIVPAKYLSQKHHCPYLFIGEHKPYPQHWLDLQVSHKESTSSRNCIIVELIPTPVNASMINSIARPSSKNWAMILGGSSRSHPYQEADWIALAKNMNTLAQLHGIKWMLSTSRRTGADVEHILQKHINPTAIQDAIWWSQKPRRELYTFMAHSSFLFVSQDSVTMVTEAVSAGRPVIALRPQNHHFDSNCFLAHYFNRLLKNKRVTGLETSQLATFTPKSSNFSLLTEDPMKKLAHQVLEKLEWD